MDKKNPNMPDKIRNPKRERAVEFNDILERIDKSIAQNLKKIKEKKNGAIDEQYMNGKSFSQKDLRILVATYPEITDTKLWETLNEQQRKWLRETGIFDEI